MSGPLWEAQQRLNQRKQELGITDSPLEDPRTWAEKRIAEWQLKQGLVPLPPPRDCGRRVRCVECGCDCRRATNRRKRLREFSCECTIHEDCGGRLRPINWFDVPEECED